MTDDHSHKPIATFDELSLPELVQMKERAWLDAARHWSEYRNAPSETDDDREVRQILHDAAWSAEHFWRALYDAVRDRSKEAAKHV
jgi:hypothetical protein